MSTWRRDVRASRTGWALQRCEDGALLPDTVRSTREAVRRLRRQGIVEACARPVKVRIRLEVCG